MPSLGGSIMEKVLFGRFRAAWMALAFALTLSGTAVGQQIPVTGTVTSSAGAPEGRAVRSCPRRGDE